MRNLSWAALGVLSVTFVATAAFTGCGSDAVPDGAMPDGGAVEGTIGSDAGGGDASTRADAADCKLEAQTCASSGECCTGNCNSTTKQCDKSLVACSPPTAACTSGPECCTFSCIGGACSTKQCVADNLACGKNEECCGGSCAGGTCTPLNGGGPATDGNPCMADGDCASKFCNAGICSAASFCGQTGEQCVGDVDCCGGLCTKAAGAALGVCGLTKAGGAGGCDPAGTLCTSTSGACGGNCCSRSCAPFGTSGKTACQPSSGCHVLGDLCRGDSDCCGWSGSPPPLVGPYECVKDSPSQEFGLCGKGNSCHEPGSICGKALEADGTTIGVCNAANNCCELSTGGPDECNSSPEKCCRRDALGVPRCIIDKNLDCTASPPPAGTVCATSADCCGRPCVENKCASSCVPTSGTCTTNADCCAGLPCAIPEGSTKGTCGGTLLPDGGVGGPGDAGSGDGGGCALYGQQCNQASDCCSGVPCTGTVATIATCRYP